jgi:hypothetical protein
MKNRDVLSSLVGLGVGFLFIAGSLHEGLFRKGIPGPGFLPFFTALILIALSSMVLFSALFGRKEKGEKPSENFFPEKDSFSKLLLALSGLSVYGIALEYIGYMGATFLFLILTSRILERKKWKGPLFLAASTALLSYLLFVVLLEVQLPRGFFGM